MTLSLRRTRVSFELRAVSTGSLWFLLLVSLVLGRWGGSLWAQPREPAVSSRAEDRQKDLEEIRRQVAALEARLTEVEDTAAGLSGQLARTEVELELQEKRLLEARTAGVQAKEQVEESGRRVADLEERLEHTRHSLRSRLRGLYRLGSLGYLRMFFSIDPGSEPLEAVRTLRYMARRDGDAITRFQETHRELEAERARLLEEQARVEEWAAAEAVRRQDLAKVQRRQAALLARLEDEQSRLTQKAEALKDKERKLSTLLDELAREAESSLSGAPIQDFRGVLDWPAEGKVLQGFGPVLDPRYGTRLPHNGIDVEVAGAGAAVRVVYPGKVLFAGPFEGYGSMIVVLHLNRAFTIYTGLKDLLVEQGDVLSLNDAVGRAEDRLYFEIRVENLPQDPLLWLR